MVDLGRLEVGRDEDVGRQTERGRRGGRGSREVPVDAHASASTPKSTACADATATARSLKLQRRVSGVVLDPQPVQAEDRRKAFGGEEWRRTHRQPAGRWRFDGEQLGVPPDPGRAGGDRLAGQGHAADP